MGRHLVRKLLLDGHRGWLFEPPLVEERGVQNSAVLMRSLGTTWSMAPAREEQKSAWAMRHHESFTYHSQGGEP